MSAVWQGAEGDGLSVWGVHGAAPIARGTDIWDALTAMGGRWPSMENADAEWAVYLEREVFVALGRAGWPLTGRRREAAGVGAVGRLGGGE